MSMRRDNRIAAMQFLYQWQINPSEDQAAAFLDFFDNLEKPREYYNFGEELAAGTLKELKEVDEVISKFTQNWDFDRIAKVDLSILRLAIYEMLFRMDIPPIVSINEAIDLAKNYSSDESNRFVNGILDQFKKTLKRPLRESQS